MTKRRSNAILKLLCGIELFRYATSRPTLGILRFRSGYRTGITVVMMATMHEMHEGAGEQYEIGEAQQDVAGVRPQEPTTKGRQEEAHD